MDKLIVGFSRPKKWKPFAWAIMKLFNIPYDHVYLKFHSNSYDRDIIYQASHLAVNFMGGKLFEEENEIFAEFQVDITPENKIKLMQFAIDNAGKPYKFKQAVGLGIVRVAEIFGKKISNPFKDELDPWVCSIIANYMLVNYANIGIDCDFADVDPKDLYEILSKKFTSIR